VLPLGADFGETRTVGNGYTWGNNDAAGPTLVSSSLLWSATFTFPEADDPNRFSESFIGIGEATVQAYKREPQSQFWKTDPTLKVYAEVFVKPQTTNRTYPNYIFTGVKLTSQPAVPEPSSIFVWCSLLALVGSSGWLAYRERAAGYDRPISADR